MLAIYCLFQEFLSCIISLLNTAVNAVRFTLDLHRPISIAIILRGLTKAAKNKGTTCGSEHRSGCLIANYVITWYCGCRSPARGLVRKVSVVVQSIFWCGYSCILGEKRGNLFAAIMGVSVSLIARQEVSLAWFCFLLLLANRNLLIGLFSWLHTYMNNIIKAGLWRTQFPCWRRLLQSNLQICVRVHWRRFSLSFTVRTQRGSNSLQICSCFPSWVFTLDYYRIGFGGLGLAFEAQL